MKHPSIHKHLPAFMSEPLLDNYHDILLNQQDLFPHNGLKIGANACLMTGLFFWLFLMGGPLPSLLQGFLRLYISGLALRNFAPTYTNLSYQVLIMNLNKYLLTHTFPPTLCFSWLWCIDNNKVTVWLNLTLRESNVEGSQRFYWTPLWNSRMCTCRQPACSWLKSVWKGCWSLGQAILLSFLWRWII